MKEFEELFFQRSDTKQFLYSGVLEYEALILA